MYTAERLVHPLLHQSHHSDNPYRGHLVHFYLKYNKHVPVFVVLHNHAWFTRQKDNIQPFHFSFNQHFLLLKT